VPYTVAKVWRVSWKKESLAEPDSRRLREDGVF
jgi:hypothetical protein